MQFQMPLYWVEKKKNGINQKYILANTEGVGNLMYYYKNLLITMSDYDHN